MTELMRRRYIICSEAINLPMKKPRRPIRNKEKKIPEFN